jgi:hypothetical protein
LVFEELKINASSTYLKNIRIEGMPVLGICKNIRIKEMPVLGI